jgi:hypothetical protein
MTPTAWASEVRRWRVAARGWVPRAGAWGLAPTMITGEAGRLLGFRWGGSQGGDGLEHGMEIQA